MAYKLTKNKSVEKSIRRIALEQINKADLKQKLDQFHARMLEIRRRCQ